MLVGSIIGQRSPGLSEFLSALAGLGRSGIEVDYLFLDDQDRPELHRQLEEFAPPDAAVALFPATAVLSDEQVPMARAERETIRNGLLKDALLGTAFDQDYDYLLLVESSVILHPQTLQHLLTLDAGVVSPVIWTRDLCGRRVPQVWLRDDETRFAQDRGERIEGEEVVIREAAFAEALKKPGIFQVGGVRDCVLISRRAIETGVRFCEIVNLSFPGEYVHFSTRAAALGIPLYVDTHYPACRFGAEEDRPGLLDYRRDVAANRYPLRQRILLVHRNPSGSNTLALSKLVPDHLRETYDIDLMPLDSSAGFLASQLDADAVIVTDGSYSLNKRQIKPKQIAIDLWHGFPLKTLGWLDKNQPEWIKGMLASRRENLDWIGSYSELFSEIMEKCYHTGDPNKFRVVGAPRNDFLFKPGGRGNLERVLKRSLRHDRVIFYMPTYRSAPGTPRPNDSERDWTNLFNMPTFSGQAFLSFLEANAITLVVKLHPAEEPVFSRFVDEGERIHLLTNAALAQNDIDLYETLNAADLLLTDYSSVFFDYLLLNRPLVFIATDVAQYAGNRGFLLEPYEAWTPGPKVDDQAGLQREILESFADPSRYEAERTAVAGKVHRYRDGEASVRVWRIVDDMLNERRDGAILPGA